MIAMFDSVNVSQLPSGAAAYAGYAGGRWPTYAVLEAKFPHALLLSIAVNASEDAMCLDVEKGDATIADVYGWFLRQQQRRVWRPCIYTSVSNVDALVRTMTANGFPRGSYRLWSAHYGTLNGKAWEHICGPATCKLTRTACDGTQWTDRALSRNLDQSILLDSFFQEHTAAAEADVTPSVTYWKTAKFYFGLGEDDRVYYREGDSGPYHLVAGPQTQHWTFTSGVGADISDAGEITVVTRGRDKSICSCVRPAGSQTWKDWVSEGGILA